MGRGWDGGGRGRGTLKEIESLKAVHLVGRGDEGDKENAFFSELGRMKMQFVFTTIALQG